MEIKNRILEDLQEFTGGTEYYIHRLHYAYQLQDIKGLLSEGIYYIAREAQCYWLINAILSHQINPIVRAHPRLKELQIWRLTYEGGLLSVACHDNKVVETQKNDNIDLTNFPLEHITLYCRPSPDGLVIELREEFLSSVERESLTFS